MIANWDAPWSLHLKIGFMNLNHWAIAILKRDPSKLGVTIASIEIQERGTLFSKHLPMTHQAEIIATVYAERYVFSVPHLGNVSDDDYGRWARERESNIAKGIPNPSESAYNVVFGNNDTGCEFG